MKPHATIGAGALVIEQNQVLLVQPNYGQAKDQWLLPGGYVNEGETPSEGALRELWEETGQIAKVKAPLCIRYRRNPSDIYWVFRAQLMVPAPLEILRAELNDARYWPLAIALKDPTVRPMTRYFLELALARTTEERPPMPPEFRQSHEVFCFSAPISAARVVAAESKTKAVG